MKYLEWRNRMAFIICVAALIIMMFVFTQMLLSFSNNSSAAVESVDATVVEKKQGIYGTFGRVYSRRQRYFFK